MSGTLLYWTGVTLSPSGTIRLQAEDQLGNGGATTVQAYLLDQTAPTKSAVAAQFSNDASSDFVVNDANQTLTGSLTAPLAADETVAVSLNNGMSWSVATAAFGSTAWTLSGVHLSGSGTMLVRVVDSAGNAGTTYTKAYVLDQSAPEFSIPVRENMVNPTGSSFAIDVSYSDVGAAGIDTSTIGTGNISVTGPGGAALTVTGYSVSGSVVTYIVAAPGGSWDPSKAGSYTIGINSSVKDLAGNAVAANPSAHTFTVSVDSAQPEPASATVSGDPLERNVFEDTSGSQRFVGGVDLDRVVFSLPRSSYQIELGADGLPASITAPNGEKDRFESIERLQFSDGILAFDEAAKQSYRLYEAAFDRDPDLGGLSFWVGMRDAGEKDILSIARDFLYAQEFTTRFGNIRTMSNEDIVELFYRNVLDRPGEAGGVAYWEGALEQGMSREHVLVLFSESAENHRAVDVELTGGVRLDLSLLG